MGEKLEIPYPYTAQIKGGPSGRLLALAPVNKGSNPDRVRLLRVDLVQLDRPGHVLAGHLALLGQGRDRRVGDVVAVHLEEAAQVGAGVGAAEAVGPQDRKSVV